MRSNVKVKKKKIPLKSWERILIVNIKNIMLKNKRLSLIINKLFIIGHDCVLKIQDI